MTVTGDGTYASPMSVLATAVGTYTWHSTYSGDTNNNPASDNGANEGLVTVTPMCPTVTGIGRIGVHHQSTVLVVTFDGTVDPTKADNTKDYKVIRPSGATVPIISAKFNPATNTVRLIPAVRLNVHYHFKLSLVIPCPFQQTPATVIVPFGSKYSLIGFHNHKGEFVTVDHGRITGFYNHQGEYIPVHRGELDRVKR